MLVRESLTAWLPQYGLTVGDAGMIHPGEMPCGHRYQGAQRVSRPWGNMQAAGVHAKRMHTLTLDCEP